jgi:hypothetical protein
MAPSGGGEGEYALYVSGHGHEAPLAARLVEPAHRNVNWRVRQSLMRTFQAMITIFIGLGLNQLRLHRGENGLALGQAQPNGLGENHICRSVPGRDSIKRDCAPDKRFGLTLRDA